VGFGKISTTQTGLCGSRYDVFWPYKLNKPKIAVIHSGADGSGYCANIVLTDWLSASNF